MWGEVFETRHFMKKAYNEFNNDYPTGCYFMSKVVCFPVSEAIVESWGSDIDDIIKSKKKFREDSDIDNTDITEKLCFIKLNRPESGKVSNRKLFKRTFCLMYDGAEYENHFRYLS